MKNPLWAYGDWRQRELERARAKGGFSLFWFYMSMGVVWSLFMVGSLTIFEYLSEGALDAGRLQRHAATYFVGGLIFGLITWVMEEPPRVRRPNNRP
jgi:hypothetical protein